MKVKRRVTLTCRNTFPPVGSTIKLQKDPNNKYDNEAIAVFVDGKPDGYVSAYYKTRKPGTVSCGRIYDGFAQSIDAIMVDELVAEVEVDSI